MNALLIVLHERLSLIVEIVWNNLGISMHSNRPAPQVAAAVNAVAKLAGRWRRSSAECFQAAS